MIKTLDLDSKRMIVAKEIDDEYIFFGCETGIIFTFDIKNFERIQKATSNEPATARFYAGNNIMFVG